MKLLIISNMPHYLRDGEVVGWGPTVQEIDHLGLIFKEIRHIACLHGEAASSSSLPYSLKRISLIPVPPAGGERLINKMNILYRAPRYLSAIVRQLSWADVIHVRCPGNIGLMAIVLLSMVRHRQRWVKYAGNWQPSEREAWSYTFQRWWLNQGLHRGVVSINGEWANQPEYVHSFLNPSLTEPELAEAKGLSLQKEISSPVRLLFVGRVEDTKGVGSALRVMSELKQRGLCATLDVVGDGPERIGFEGQARTLGIESLVKFHGWLPKPALSTFYAKSHLMLLPTRCSEGWPKVLSEAMAYGAVPITSTVSCIPQLLKKFETGRVVGPDDIAGICRAVFEYSERPRQWKKESERAVSAAELFTYDNYLKAVRQLLKVA